MQVRVAFRSNANANECPSDVRAVNDTFDYEQKYEADPEFEELSPKARVWRMYMDESTKYDVERVQDWREALDVLLVFVSFVFKKCYPLQFND